MNNPNMIQETNARLGQGTLTPMPQLDLQIQQQNQTPTQTPAQEMRAPQKQEIYFDIEGARETFGDEATLKFLANSDTNLNWQVIGEHLKDWEKKNPNANSLKYTMDEFVKHQDKIHFYMDVASQTPQNENSATLDSTNTEKTQGLRDTQAEHDKNKGELQRKIDFHEALAEKVRNDNDFDPAKYTKDELDYIQNTMIGLYNFGNRTYTDEKIADRVLTRKWLPNADELTKASQMTRIKDFKTLLSMDKGVEYDQMTDEQRKLYERMRSGFVQKWDEGFFGLVNDTRNESAKAYTDSLSTRDITKDIAKSVMGAEAGSASRGVLSALHRWWYDDPEAWQAKYGQSAADFEKNLADVVHAAGAKGAFLGDDGGTYIIVDTPKGEEYLRLNTDMTENFGTMLKHHPFEVGLAVASVPIVAAAATASGAGSLVTFGAVAAGSAIASAVGAGLDLNNLEKEYGITISEQDKRDLMLEAGILDLTAGAVLTAAGKTAKVAINKTANAPQAVRKIVDNASGYVMGNQNRIQKEIIDNQLSPTEQKYLADFNKNFGLEAIAKGAKPNYDELEKLRIKVGENSVTYKGAKAIYDAFTLQGSRNFQANLVRIARADDTGLVWKHLVEAANVSPNVSNTLRSIINTTHHNLMRDFERLGLEKQSIKNILNDLEKGTKESFNEAMTETLESVYKDVKVVATNDNLVAKVADKIPAFTEAKGFQKLVVDVVYNPQGVTLKELNAARAYLNSFYKNSEPGFKEFISREIDAGIRADIEKAAEQILAADPRLAQKATDLYKTSLKDYADMKGVLKTAKELKLLKEKTSFEQAIENLKRYLSGQGDGNLASNFNFNAITKGLSKQEKDIVESSVLLHILKKSEMEKLGAKAIDTDDFFKRLGELNHEFQSDGAKQILRNVENYRRLFANDSKILAQLEANTTPKQSTGLATTLKGAAKYMMTARLVRTIWRMAPKTGFKFLDERTANAAARYHMQKYLESSVDVTDLINKVDADLERKGFDNATKQKLKEFRDLMERDQNAAIEYVKRGGGDDGSSGGAGGGGVPPSDGGGGGGGVNPTPPSQSTDLMDELAPYLPKSAQTQNKGQDLINNLFGRKGARVASQKQGKTRQRFLTQKQQYEDFVAQNGMEIADDGRVIEKGAAQSQSIAPTPSAPSLRESEAEAISKTETTPSSVIDDVETPAPSSLIDDVDSTPTISKMENVENAPAPKVESGPLISKTENTEPSPTQTPAAKNPQDEHIANLQRQYNSTRDQIISLYAPYEKLLEQNKAETLDGLRAFIDSQNFQKLPKDTQEALKNIYQKQAELENLWDEIQIARTQGVKPPTPTNEMPTISKTPQTDFTEFYGDVVGAVKKLDKEKTGQVSNIATKKILDKDYQIGLEYGDEKSGLAHMKKHMGEFKKYGEGIDGLAKGLDDVIQNSVFYKFNNNKIELVTDKYMLILGKRPDNKSVVVTAFRNRKVGELAETSHTGVVDDFTDGTLGVSPSAKQPLSETIPQNTKNVVDSTPTESATIKNTAESSVETTPTPKVETPAETTPPKTQGESVENTQMPPIRDAYETDNTALLGKSDSEIIQMREEFTKTRKQKAMDDNSITPENYGEYNGDVAETALRLNDEFIKLPNTQSRRDFVKQTFENGTEIEKAAISRLEYNYLHNDIYGIGSSYDRIRNTTEYLIEGGVPKYGKNHLIPLNDSLYDMEAGIETLAKQKHGQVGYLNQFRTLDDEYHIAAMPYGEWDSATKQGFGLAKMLNNPQDFVHFYGDDTLTNIKRFLSDAFYYGEFNPKNNTIQLKRAGEYILLKMKKESDRKGQMLDVIYDYEKSKTPFEYPRYHDDKVNWGKTIKWDGVEYKVPNINGRTDLTPQLRKRGIEQQLRFNEAMTIQKEVVEGDAKLKWWEVVRQKLGRRPFTHYDLHERSAFRPQVEIKDGLIFWEKIDSLKDRLIAKQKSLVDGMRDVEVEKMLTKFPKDLHKELLRVLNDDDLKKFGLRIDSEKRDSWSELTKASVAKIKQDIKEKGEIYQHLKKQIAATDWRTLIFDTLKNGLDDVVDITPPPHLLKEVEGLYKPIPKNTAESSVEVMPTPKVETTPTDIAPAESAVMESAPKIETPTQSAPKTIEIDGREYEIPNAQNIPAHFNQARREKLEWLAQDFENFHTRIENNTANEQTYFLRDRDIKAWNHYMNLERELQKQLENMPTLRQNILEWWKNKPLDLCGLLVGKVDRGEVPPSFRLKTRDDHPRLTDASIARVKADVKKEGKITTYMLDTALAERIKDIYAEAEKYGVKLDAPTPKVESTPKETPPSIENATLKTTDYKPYALSDDEFIAIGFDPQSSMAYDMRHLVTQYRKATTKETKDNLKASFNYYLNLRDNFPYYISQVLDETKTKKEMAQQLHEGIAKLDDEQIYRWLKKNNSRTFRVAEYGIDLNDKSNAVAKTKAAFKNETELFGDFIDNKYLEYAEALINYKRFGNFPNPFKTDKEWLDFSKKHGFIYDKNKPTKQSVKSYQQIKAESAPTQRSSVTPKTIQNIDSFMKLDVFKRLPKEKQDAFLRLKEVTPAKVPTELSVAEFLQKEFSVDITNRENFIVHTKKDEPQRIDFIHLIEPTMESPHLLLHSKNKKGEPTIEYIKVFDDGKDRFYVAITKDDGKTLMTTIPTTKFRDIRRRIIDATKIQHEIDGGISSAQSSLKGNAPKLGEIIPQNAKNVADSTLTESTTAKSAQKAADDEPTPFIYNEESPFEESKNIKVYIDKSIKDVYTPKTKLEQLLMDTESIYKSGWHYELSVFDDTAYIYKSDSERDFTYFNDKLIQRHINTLKQDLASDPRLKIAAAPMGTAGRDWKIPKKYLPGLNYEDVYKYPGRGTILLIQRPSETKFRILEGKELDELLDTITEGDKELRELIEINLSGKAATNKVFQFDENDLTHNDIFWDIAGGMDIKDAVKEYVKKNGGANIIFRRKELLDIIDERYPTPKVYRVGGSELYDFVKKAIEATDKEQVLYKMRGESVGGEISKISGAFDLSNNRQRVELRNAFYRGADSASKEIYRKVESAIKDSGVRVEFADEMGKTLALGEYHADQNLIKIKKGMKEGETSNTILHEMIHAATAHAIKNPANLTPKQRHAIGKLQKIYAEAKAANTDARLDYAFKNLDEFVAELSNPALSQSLKSGGFFERIIDAIAQFFGIAGISKSSQARKALYDLLDTSPKGKSDGVLYKIYKERTESAGVKDDRIAAKSQGAKVAQELKEALKKDLLGVDGKIDISKFEAQPLPKADFKSREQFKAKFKNVDGRMGTAETALGDMLVDTHYAYRHFYINTNNKNRNYLKGAFFDILQNPLAISKYGNSVYFFKIYNYKGSNKGIFSIGINLYDGSLKYKTTYDDIEKNRMAEMLKKHEVISYKGKGNSR